MEQPYIPSYNRIYLIGTTQQIPAIEEYHFQVSPKFLQCQVKHQTMKTSSSRRFCLKSPSENLPVKIRIQRWVSKSLCSIEAETRQSTMLLGASWGGNGLKMTVRTPTKIWSQNVPSTGNFQENLWETLPLVMEKIGKEKNGNTSFCKS